MSTKKVGSTGRFNERYGVGIRKRVLKVEQKMNKAISCPFCSFLTIKRTAAGLYVCRKCGAKFTGGAYEAETLIGKTIKKMIAQKTFLEGSKELIKSTEDMSGMEKEVAESIKE
jgi:large subunit ribosomal protein L37Ae